MSNQRQRITQASSENVVQFPEPRIVSGHRARDKWMIELTKARDTMPPLNYAAGMRLALFLNCTTGQCNPGYPRLSRDLGCTLASAKRACRELDRDGWIKRNQTPGGDHEDKTEFDFLTPYERVSAPDTRDATDHGCPKQAGTGVQKPGGRVSITDSLMNTEGTLKNTESAASAARSADADRDEDNIEQILDQYSRARASGAPDPYDDPDFISFEPEPRCWTKPTSTLLASS